MRSQDRPAAERVYEGRIKDVSPAWGLLALTVGQCSEARDLCFDIREARIVGSEGAERKGQDLGTGDRVRVQLTADGRLVQQVSILADRTSGPACGGLAAARGGGAGSSFPHLTEALIAGR